MIFAKIFMFSIICPQTLIDTILIFHLKMRISVRLGSTILTNKPHFRGGTAAVSVMLMEGPNTPPSVRQSRDGAESATVRS